MTWWQIILVVLFGLAVIYSFVRIGFWGTMMIIGFSGLIGYLLVEVGLWETLLIGLGILVITGGFGAFIWYYLAPTNRFFTFVREGTAKVAVKGDAFNKVLIQWDGRTFDYEVVNEERWNVIEGVEPWHPLGGLRFYGLWPIWDIYGYDFTWTGVTQDGRIEVHPKETLDFIMLQDDVYWAKVEAAEDQDLFPLDIELVLTIRVINPYKALFRIENWLETVINRSRPSVRDVISKDKYQEWIKSPEDVANRILTDLTGRGLIAEFADRYGVELRKVEVKEINPPPTFREATLKKWSAERERERILVEADAEQSRISTVYGAVLAMGDLGQLVRTLEAMERSPERGAKWVIPLPGMADLFARAFPGRVQDTLTREEIIRAIQEELRRREGG